MAINNVQNNMSALYTSRQNAMNASKMQTAAARLSSGARINAAKDDPAGLGISEMMRSQQTGIQRALQNALDGNSLVQTAEGALGSVHNMLNRLTDLAGQASNGILSSSQRQNINSEAQQILQEIDRVSQATNFNGINLLDGSLSSGSTVSDMQTTTKAATAGSATFNDILGMTGIEAGQEVSFSLGTTGGDFEMSFTVSDDMTQLVAEDGRTYDITAAAEDGKVYISGEDLTTAIKGEMEAGGLDQKFNIKQDGSSLSLTSKEAGADGLQVTHMSYSLDNKPISNIGASISKGKDAVDVISADSLKAFNGKNTSDSVFTVNGKSFALVHETNFDQYAKKLPDGVTAIRVQGGLGNSLTEQDLRHVSSVVNRAANTNFTATENGIEVRAKEGNALSLQVGTSSDGYNSIKVDIGDMSVKGLGLDGLDLSTQDGARAALDKISSAINTVSDARGSLGATQNRLDNTISNLSVTYENITASESRIRDADMAKSIMDFMRDNILSQSNMAMQAQGNLQSQQVLQFLR